MLVELLVELLLDDDSSEESSSQSVSSVSIEEASLISSFALNSSSSASVESKYFPNIVSRQVKSAESVEKTFLKSVKTLSFNTWIALDFSVKTES